MPLRMVFVFVLGLFIPILLYLFVTGQGQDAAGQSQSFMYDDVLCVFRLASARFGH